MPQDMKILNCLNFDKIIFDPEVEVDGGERAIEIQIGRAHV